MSAVSPVVAQVNLSGLTNRLIVEYSGSLPAGVVIRCVARTRRDLLLAGIRSEFADHAEHAIRRRLVERLAAGTSSRLVKEQP